MYGFPIVIGHLCHSGFRLRADGVGIFLYAQYQHGVQQARGDCQVTHVERCRAGGFSGFYGDALDAAQANVIRQQRAQVGLMRNCAAQKIPNIHRLGGKGGSIL